MVRADPQWLEGDGTLGPHMQNLTVLQRAFVDAIMQQSIPNWTQAAKDAGYAAELKLHDLNRYNLNCRNIGYALAHDPKIIEAIKEESHNRIRMGTHLASRALVEIAMDPTSKSRVQAAVALLKHGGIPEQSESKLTIRDERQKTPEQLWAEVQVIAKKWNMDPHELIGQNVEVPLLPAPVDAEFTEVSTEGLEDLL